MLIIFFSFVIFFTTLNFLRERYHPPEEVEPTTSGLKVDMVGNGIVSNLLPLKWKYRAGDDTLWRAKNFDDSAWMEVAPVLNMKDEKIHQFKGICWFRLHVKLPKELVNRPVALKLEHFGASEVYLDSILIYESGTVSADPAGERPEMATVPVFFSLPDTLEHLFAVRYSNQNYRKNFESYDEADAGITARFLPNAQASVLVILANSRIAFWFIVLFVFFLTLGIVHALLYAFYPKMKENLYYSLFVILFSIMILGPYFLINTQDPSLAILIKYYYVVPALLFILSVGLCLYSLFRPTYWKRMLKIQILVCIGCLFTYYFESLQTLCNLFMFCNILFTCIEAVRTVIFAIRKKMLGSAIIGTGVLIFFVFIFLLLVEAIVLGNVGMNVDDESGVYVFTIVFICIISIPLSMSIYLAYVFAFTNRNLEEKLVEVEELSARSLAQEKEKQQILSDQNVTLEKQVTERTLEIVEQKKVIEEKNKDIIDSINYAKRIQSAMLPEESVFKNIFSNSFILYQPRDIVSGDFYYAAELNGDKLIVAADCTGHGVPGALMSMVGCNIIQKLSNENEISDPKLLLETLHTELRSALKQNIAGSVNRDGMDLAAVLIRKNDILFSSANRPVIWFDHKNELRELKPTKTPVGGSHIEKVDLQLISLDKKEVKQLFLFSDGFADQFGGPEGKKLMVSKFKLWLNQIISLSSEEQLKFLSDNFSDWKNTNEQVDDVMVIGIKV
jgi:serine phosphatase RsbU (regulator of sigma subunit)